MNLIKHIRQRTLAAAIMLCSSGQMQAAEPIYYDLTHPLPLFAPLGGDITRADLSAPERDSQPIAGSGGAQAVRIAKPSLTVKNGTLRWGNIFLDEHYSTHIDSTDHFITDRSDLLPKMPPDIRSVDEFSLDELIGPIVYIDISERVSNELKKNQGRPSPDLSLTNFDNRSGNNVMKEDIDAIAEYLLDGAYLVIRTSWDKFFQGAPPPQNSWAHPYSNGLNHPGITPEAVDRLIEIEDQRGIRIAGLVADNMAIESGHSSRGPSIQAGTVPTLSEVHMYLHPDHRCLETGWCQRQPR
jgi:kynurenine formamidase